MRSILIIFTFGLLTSNAHCQLSERQHVFDKTTEVRPTPAGTLRYTPSTAEINTADSLAEIHIKNNRKEYSWTGEISDYKSYYRQYVGYLNLANDRIVFINSFCRPEANWKKQIVSYRGGGSCFFDIKVNLDTGKVYEFYVNAPR